MTDECPHHRQSARITENDPTLYEYHCLDCGGITGEGTECYPPLSLLYYRSSDKSWEFTRPGIEPLCRGGKS